MRASRISRRQLFTAAAWMTTSSTAPTKGVGQEVGLPKWELDTPALCVDLDKLERNLRTLQSTAANNGIGVRPHGKTHRCPAIAHLQMKLGAIGICAAKVSEAEAMFEHGIDEILLTTPNVTATKIRRAMNLRRRCSGFLQSSDSEENARRLDEAASAAGVTADVVLHLDNGGHRGGVLPGQEALALGQLVDRLPRLRLRGVYCYDGRSQHVEGFDERREQTLERMAAAADTFAAMQRAGLEVEIFSGGGTGTYNIDHEIPGFTDTQAGSYAFMDAQYQRIGGKGVKTFADFAPALTILTTVVHVHSGTHAMTDAGANACTSQSPVIVTDPDVEYRSRADEGGMILYSNLRRDHRVGDTLELLPSNCDPVVNLFDRLYGIRSERVETVWRVVARGMSQ